MTLFKLNRSIAIEEGVKETVELVDYVSTRPDFPTRDELSLTDAQVARIPELLVCRPDYNRTKDDQHNVTEFILPNDLTDGGMSPSVILLYCLLPILALVTRIGFAVGVTGQSVGGFRGGLLQLIGWPLLLLALYYSSSVARAVGRSLSGKVQMVMAWLSGFATPFGIAAMGFASPEFYQVGGVSLLGPLGWVGGLLVFGLAISVIVALICLLVKGKEGLDLCKVYSTSLLMMSANVIAVGLIASCLQLVFGDLQTGLGLKVGQFMYATVPFMLAYVHPWLLARQEVKARKEEQLVFASLYNGGNKAKRSNAIVARQERIQACESAGKNHEPPFVAGKSTGFLFNNGCPRAIPGGMDVQWTAKDAGTHIFVVGETGGGKSTGAAQRWGDYWILNGFGGSFWVDGKGELPLLYANARNFNLIDYTSTVAPFEGLGPDEIVSSIEQACEVNLSNAKDGGNAIHFNQRADAVLTAMTHLMFAMVESEKECMKHNKLYFFDVSDERTWFRDPDSLMKIHMAAKSWKDGYSTVMEFTRFVRLWHPAIERIKEKDADGNDTFRFNYKCSTEAQVLNDHLKFLDSLGEGAGEELAGVFSTIENMIKPLFGNAKLRKWASTETGGFQFEKVLYGAHVGINLNVDEFGRSALLYTALLRQRVMRAVKKRTKGWEERDPRQKPILMLMDECHSKGVIDRDDAEFSSKCRGWKLQLFCLTQSMESMVNAIDQDATDALLQNFKIKIFFRNQDSKRTMQYAMDTVGKGHVQRWKKKLVPVSLIETAKVAASSTLRNQDHEDAAFYREVRRYGGGRISIRAGNYEGKELFDYHAQSKGESLQMCVDTSQIKPVIDLVEEEDYWVSEADYRDNLAPKGRALIQWIRGGVPFAEFVEVPYQEFPTKEIMRKPGEVDEEIILPKGILWGEETEEEALADAA